MAVPSLSSLTPQAIHDIAVTAKNDLCSSEHKLAACLLEIERRQLFYDWGVSCTLDYAELILGFSAHTAREMMRMARALAGLPKLAEAYYGGRVAASKMREITRVAAPETEDLWIEMAAKHNTRQIEMAVARTSKGERPGSLRPDDKRPQPVRTRIRLDLSPEQMAIVLEAADLVTKIAGERVGLSEAIELMAQDFLRPPRAGRPQPLSPDHSLRPVREDGVGKHVARAPSRVGRDGRAGPV